MLVMSEFQKPAAAISRPSAPVVVEVQALTKHYAGAQASAVCDVSFSVHQGECLGLLGPNGAGKSTLIGMLASLIRPTGGQARICGHNIVTHTQQVQSCIGLIPQDLALYPTLTARENLSYFGRLHGLRGQTLRRLVDEALAVVGLSDRANDIVEKFSGGMKRRVNLAAGLLHRPKVVFLDEPTVGVDPQSRSFILPRSRRSKHRAQRGSIPPTIWKRQSGCVTVSQSSITGVWLRSIRQPRGSKVWAMACGSSPYPRPHHTIWCSSCGHCRMSTTFSSAIVSGTSKAVQFIALCQLSWQPGTIKGWQSTGSCSTNRILSSSSWISPAASCATKRRSNVTAWRTRAYADLSNLFGHHRLKLRSAICTKGCAARAPERHVVRLCTGNRTRAQAERHLGGTT
ncbi:ABC transporter ATP-binding protein [Candidatus Gracilibacteria bacterium]|nr:ABC transporter ATP-binding protein [Candidatus Gracilibacteria bacterium]